MFSKISVVVAALAATVAAKDGRTFAVMHFYGKGPLVTGRMDPIVNPGTSSSHEHAIMGGSNFGLTMDDTTLLSSTCTTAIVKNDKSNYWTPSVYFQDPVTKAYSPVKFNYMNVYYFFEGTDDKIVAFPPGLRMLVGDASKRTPPSTGGSINVLSSRNPVAQPVQFTCPRQNYNVPSYPADSDGLHGFGLADPNNKGAGAGFPNAQCDGTYSPLRADIHFPSCYNPAAGLRNYKENMVYPTDNGKGKQNCPAGYLHVPHLFYEVYWDTQEFKDRWTPGKDAQPFVLANGDSTGYSLHGDFISGWDEATLQQIIDNCDAGDSGMENCPNVIGGFNDRKTSCNIPNQILEAASVDDMTHLPGNLLTTGFGAVVGALAPVQSAIASLTFPNFFTPPKTTAAAAAATTTAAAAPPASTPTPASQPPSTGSSLDGWSQEGCYSDDVDNRALSGKQFVIIGNHQVTSWGCLVECDKMGFSIAGTEYGSQCFCGNSLDGSSKIDEGTCNMACEGDAGQNCGGKSALLVFKKGNVTLKAREAEAEAGSEVAEEALLAGEAAKLRMHRHIARHMHKAAF